MIPVLTPGHRDFELLARGGGDSSTVNMLLDGQFSRNVLLIRAVIEASGEPADPALISAYRLLARVQRVRPDIIREALTRPGIGLWGQACLRSPDPADAHGYLSRTAVAAALRSGIDFEIGTPLADVARWPEPPTLHASEGGRSITVQLDNTDPYLAPSWLRPAPTVTPGETARWQDLFTGAWRILVRRHPAHAEAMAAGLRVLVPLASPGAGHSESATIRNAFGAALLTPPADESHLALTLIHEFQHSKLAGLENLVALHFPDADGNSARYYAPWRDDPRPPSGLLQGAYAHLGVADFWRAARHADPRGDSLPHLQFAWWRESVRQALDELDACGSLSVPGRRFVAGMRTVIDGWRDEEIPARARKSAADFLFVNQAVWRMRHLRPQADAVERLVRSWESGADRPDGAPLAPPELSTGPRAPIGADRLLRAALASAAKDPWPGNSADADYVRGRTAAALDGYRAELAVSPSEPEAWAGLALCLSRLAVGGDRPGPLAPFNAQPELARAVYLRIRESGGNPDPAALALWLAGDGAVR